MKDSEFYTVSEEWPQPPDEACTLQGGQTTTLTRPKKKTNSRVRKKLSESLAGVTAAAVAVVMVVSSLPSLKDVFDDIPIPDDIIPEASLGSGEPCLVCGERGCPYMVWDEPGLYVNYPGQTAYLPYDLYQMNGFTERDRELDLSCYILRTETHQRLVLEVDMRLFDDVTRGGHWMDVLINSELWEEDKPGASGKHYQIYDEKSGDLQNEVYLYLAYSPDGDFSQLDLEEDLTGLEFRAFPVANVPNAQIHVYTDLGEEFISKVEENCQVEVLEEETNRFTLGDTMYFQEQEYGYRIFNDEMLSYLHVYLGAMDENALYWHFVAGFDIKRYFTNDAEICFASASWISIFEQWKELNGLAPKYGHKVCFPIVDLGEAAVNRITYHCYAIYMNDDSEDRRDVTFVCVPVQEPEILISLHYYQSEEEMAALLSGEIDAAYVTEEGILTQITLR